MFIKSHIKSETRQKLTAYLTPAFWLLLLITSFLERLNTSEFILGFIDGLLVVSTIAFIVNLSNTRFGG